MSKSSILKIVTQLKKDKPEHWQRDVKYWCRVMAEHECPKISYNADMPMIEMVGRKSRPVCSPPV
jgi:hypothetical protein